MLRQLSYIIVWAQPKKTQTPVYNIRPPYSQCLVKRDTNYVKSVMLVRLIKQNFV